MENMKTLAFQVPKSLFQQIKEYLHRNHVTQKQFVIGLIEAELNRDLEQRQESAETQDISFEQDEAVQEDLDEDEYTDLNESDIDKADSADEEIDEPKNEEFDMTM